MVATQSLAFLNPCIKIEKQEKKTKNLCTTFLTKLGDKVSNMSSLRERRLTVQDLYIIGICMGGSRRNQQVCDEPENMKTPTQERGLH